MDNIIELAQWKPKKPALTSTWIATESNDDSAMSEEEMLATWGLTEEELGDLSFWGIDFRKSVLLQHATDMRTRDAELPKQLPMAALGEQLALAVGASLISRTSVKEIGELVDSLLNGDDKIIAAHFKDVRKVADVVMDSM
jgi:hypothetical protein